MFHESGYMPPGAEIAMQRADERSAYVEMRVEEFKEEYVKEALQCIANETLMAFDSDPSEAAYEHLDEADGHKFMQCFAVAYEHLPADAPIPLRNAIQIGFERVKQAVEAAAAVEARHKLNNGYFDDGGCDDLA